MIAKLRLRNLMYGGQVRWRGKTTAISKLAYQFEAGKSIFCCVTLH